MHMKTLLRSTAVCLSLGLGLASNAAYATDPGPGADRDRPACDEPRTERREAGGGLDRYADR